jgi:hypothetical protein
MYWLYHFVSINFTDYGLRKARRVGGNGLRLRIICVDFEDELQNQWVQLE